MSKQASYPPKPVKLVFFLIWLHKSAGLILVSLGWKYCILTILERSVLRSVLNVLKDVFQLNNFINPTCINFLVFLVLIIPRHVKALKILQEVWKSILLLLNHQPVLAILSVCLWWQILVSSPVWWYFLHACLFYAFMSTLEDVNSLVELLVSVF